MPKNTRSKKYYSSSSSSDTDYFSPEEFPELLAAYQSIMPTNAELDQALKHFRENVKTNIAELTESISTVTESVSTVNESLSTVTATANAAEAATVKLGEQVKAANDIGLENKEAIGELSKLVSQLFVTITNQTNQSTTEPLATPNDSPRNPLEEAAANFTRMPVGGAQVDQGQPPVGSGQGGQGGQGQAHVDPGQTTSGEPATQRFNVGTPGANQGHHNAAPGPSPYEAGVYSSYAVPHVPNIHGLEITPQSLKDVADAIREHDKRLFLSELEVPNFQSLTQSWLNKRNVLNVTELPTFTEVDSLTKVYDNVVKVQTTLKSHGILFSEWSTIMLERFDTAYQAKFNTMVATATWEKIICFLLREINYSSLLSQFKEEVRVALLSYGIDDVPELLALLHLKLTSGYFHNRKVNKLFKSLLIDDFTFGSSVLFNYYKDAPDIANLNMFHAWLHQFPEQQLIYWKKAKENAAASTTTTAATTTAGAPPSPSVSVNALQTQKRFSTRSTGRPAGGRPNQGRYNGGGNRFSNRSSGASSSQRGSTFNNKPHWRSNRFQKFKRNFTSGVKKPKCSCVICQHIDSNFYIRPKTFPDGNKVNKVGFKSATISGTEGGEADECPYQITEDKFEQNNNFLLEDIYQSLEYDEQMYYHAMVDWDDELEEDINETVPYEESDEIVESYPELLRQD